VRHEETQLRSNPQFADLLKEFGVEPPMKVSPTTGKETYAFAKTDEEFRALLEHENDYVQALVAARLGVRSTIEETRTERFMAIADRGPLPIPLRYYAAHTGRWGGDEKINMQNLPRGSALKKAICAPEGYVFIDCDLSQIEARTLAWLAEQGDLVDAFTRGDDVYSIMASNIYYKPVDQITKEERFVGKTTILGAGYGMGAQKFQLQLGRIWHGSAEVSATA
jgi:DNA polymerase